MGTILFSKQLISHWVVGKFFLKMKHTFKSALLLVLVLLLGTQITSPLPPLYQPPWNIIELSSLTNCPYFLWAYFWWFPLLGVLFPLSESLANQILELLDWSSNILIFSFLFSFFMLLPFLGECLNFIFCS